MNYYTILDKNKNDLIIFLDFRTHSLLLQQHALLYRPFEKGVQNGFFNKKTHSQDGATSNKCNAIVVRKKNLTNDVKKILLVL